MTRLPVFVVALALSASIAPGQTTALALATGPPAVQQRQTSKLKGTMKSLNDGSAVIVPSDNKRTEVAFRVTATTERTGALASGDAVEVVYYFEQSQRVATALIGKAAAQ